MIALKRILVATDFSGPSDAALAYGCELARMFGAQLVLLHVLENTLTRAVGGDGFVYTDPDLQAAVEAAGKKRLDVLVSDEDRVRLRLQSVVVTSNAPALAIVAFAKSGGGINLIVMGTHGRGGLAHVLLGSVTERVVRLAPCPVLTVRHPEREFVVPDAFAAIAARDDAHRDGAAPAGALCPTM